MLVRKPPEIKTQGKSNRDNSQIGNNGTKMEVVLLPQELVTDTQVPVPKYFEDNPQTGPEIKVHGRDYEPTNFIYHINQEFTSHEKQTNVTEDSIVSKKSSIIVMETDLQVTGETSKNEKKNCCADRDELKSLFTNILFLRHLLMTCLGVVASFGILYLLPALAKEWGADDFVSSLTVTVTGASEIIAR